MLTGELLLDWNENSAYLYLGSTFLSGNGINVFTILPVHTENLICKLMSWLQLSNISLHIYGTLQICTYINMYAAFTFSHPLRKKDNNTPYKRNTNLSAAFALCKIIEKPWIFFL